ncbi:MAG: response regulator [Arenimonas sp.]
MTTTEVDKDAARLLIVDDQHANVELLQALLADAGYAQVMATTDPRKAAPLHDQHHFDLILLDLQMPGMDGFEVMAALREIEPDGYLPVLVLTGQPGLKLRALQAGARDFLSKPFELFELQARIHNLLLVRLLYRRVAAQNQLLEHTVAERTAELRLGEARFRSLLELACDFYWETDAEGRFTHVAGPAMELLGLSQAPEGGKAPRWNGEQRELEARLATREAFLDLVHRRVRADGSVQFVQTSGEPGFDAGGRFTGYRGVGKDVTERVRAQPPWENGP